MTLLGCKWIEVISQLLLPEKKANDSELLIASSHACTSHRSLCEIDIRIELKSYLKCVVKIETVIIGANESEDVCILSLCPIQIHSSSSTLAHHHRLLRAVDEKSHKQAKKYIYFHSSHSATYTAGRQLNKAVRYSHAINFFIFIFLLFFLSLLSPPRVSLNLISFTGKSCL